MALALLVGVAGCRGSLELEPSDAATVLSRQVLEEPDPGEPGPHEVLTLTYGSGTDRHRPEYGDSVTLVTESVDGSKLVELGSSADDREAYWGFTPEAFPLNARVWYPDGEGPFPLVLVVHGNHAPRDFSDPGYDYLGELLASRGMILASVDMNFINGGIRGENDARGWLLLKHLQVWDRFNREEEPFRGKVDMERIALMGHSRGGEAVGHAAAFNRLERYPDDASLTFDFGFDIRGIVAIAPVDGQYLPTGRYVPVEDVSYLVFHGSHDGDVTSFHGLRQYNRVTFEPGSGHFKSALYMYRANHGQWNTVWGALDNGPRSGRILDLRALIEPEKQRRFAEIYVSAFLESVLRDDDRWLPLFRDHRVAGGWLPETMYITRYEPASFRALARFEDDIDVTTGSSPRIRLRGDSLETWKEGRLDLRSRNRSTTSGSQDNQAVWLGWNNRVEGADTADHGPPARFVVEMPSDLAAEWELDGDASLHLLLTATERVPGPREAPDEGSDEEESETEEDEAAEGEEDESREGGDDDEGEPPPVDLSVEVEDAAGTVGRVTLSEYGSPAGPTWRRSASTSSGRWFSRATRSASPTSPRRRRGWSWTASGRSGSSSTGSTPARSWWTTSASHGWIPPSGRRGSNRPGARRPCRQRHPRLTRWTPSIPSTGCQAYSTTRSSPQNDPPRVRGEASPSGTVRAPTRATKVRPTTGQYPSSSPPPPIHSPSPRRVMAPAAPTSRGHRRAPYPPKASVAVTGWETSVPATTSSAPRFRTERATRPGPRGVEAPRSTEPRVSESEPKRWLRSFPATPRRRGPTARPYPTVATSSEAPTGPSLRKGSRPAGRSPAPGDSHESAWSPTATPPPYQSVAAERVRSRPTSPRCW